MAIEVWRVGELSRRSGLSVRTLHPYDAIGLLSPVHRSKAGYRLYTPTDVTRLQQIRSLRGLGFPLGEIRNLLDRADVSPAHVIDLHIRRLKEHVALQSELCRRLEGIAAHFSEAKEVTPDTFFQVMELMSMMEKIKTYYTPEQLETLEQRRQELGEVEIRRVVDEWPRLIAEMRTEMERGTDPADEHVQSLARRWKSLLDGFTGGDPGITKSLRTMYQSEPDTGTQVGLDQHLFGYVGRALEAEGE